MSNAGDNYDLFIQESSEDTLRIVKINKMKGEFVHYTDWEVLKRIMFNHFV